MAENDPHPIAHVDANRCYEWMLAERARLSDARQAREDGLIQTVTQISSAALLAIPALLLGSELGIPTFVEAPLVYLGGAGFILALAAAMVEQHLSGLAFKRQITIVQKYYTKQSVEREDKEAIRRLRIARYVAYGLFGTAVLATAIGLMSIEGEKDGTTSTSSPASVVGTGRDSRSTSPDGLIAR